MPCRRYVVTGKVQGVWFRASTREQALALALGGHAVNLPDGSVEVVACGDTVALQRLEDWLHVGPRLARVDAVTCEQLPEQVIGGFETG